MKSSVILGGLALFASSSVALPTAAVGSFNNFYTVVARMTDLMHKKRGSNKKTKECIGTLPSLPQSTLPPPSDGTYLYLITIGRGTQNYTCADSTSATKPVAVGAVATLYNATCLATTSPAIFDTLTRTALAWPGSDDSATDPIPQADKFISGHHYFTKGATAGMPTFDLVTKKNDDGIFFGAKRAAADAPNKAIDVAWLKLGHVDGCTKGLYEVYRVKTAGGVPPKTCEGLESKFEIQYAAEYWFYAQYVY